MAFQFTLAALLRYRKAREESERLRLHELHARRNSLHEELRQTHERKLKLQRSMASRLQQSAARAIEIQACWEWSAALDRGQQQLQIVLLQVQREIAVQTQRYREERQKCEILESLRELQLGEYQLQEQRRRQAMLDEMYLLQRAKREKFA